MKNKLALTALMAMVETNPSPEVFEITNSYAGLMNERISYKGKTAPVRTEPKIGRNELCPCGSKMKHKKCCLIKP